MEMAHESGQLLAANSKEPLAVVAGSIVSPLLIPECTGEGVVLRCCISVRPRSTRMDLISSGQTFMEQTHMSASTLSVARYDSDKVRHSAIAGRCSRNILPFGSSSGSGTGRPGIANIVRGECRGYHVHPAALDASLQLSAVIHGQWSKSVIPVGFGASTADAQSLSQLGPLTASVINSSNQNGGGTFPHQIFSQHGMCASESSQYQSLVTDMEARAVDPRSLAFVSQEASASNKSRGLRAEKLKTYWPVHSISNGGEEIGNGDGCYVALNAPIRETCTATIGMLQSMLVAQSQGMQISSSPSAGVLPVPCTMGGLSASGNASLVKGILRTACMEFPGYHCSYADKTNTDLDKRLKFSSIFSGSDAVKHKASIGSILHTPVLAPCSDTPGDQQLPSPVASNNLITGGTGVLGSLVASWLALHSASRLCLLGRTGKASSNTLSLLSLQKNSIITIMQCDVAATEDARSLFQGDCKEHLQAIMHAGGVLADATLQKQTAGAARRVFAPKITGLCDQISKQSWLGLQQQVLFSSIAALYGSPGQLNYSGANAVLDAMAHAGRASGMPMLSLQWGAWGGSGMATRDAGTARRMERLGIGMLQPFDGLTALQAILGDAPGAQVAVTPMVWEVFTRQDFGFPEGFLAEFSKPKPQQTSQARLTAPRSLASHDTPPPVTTQADHGAAMRDIVVEAVTGIVGAEIGGMEPLVAAGLDSLGAVELRNSLEERTGLQLSPTLLFDYPTVDEVVAHLQTLVPEAHARDQAHLMEADLGYSQVQAQEAPSAEYLQQEVSEAVSAILGAEVDLTQPLVAAGIDSLGAVELRNNLEARMGFQLPPTLLFDYPTVSDLAGYLQGHVMASSGVSTRPLPLAMDRVLIPKQEMARESRTAVLGMAARLPYDVLGEFKACDMVSVVPMGRWDVDGHNAQTGVVTTSNRYGVWLDAVADFDGGAFGVADAEAALMDPQHRLLMETAWEAMQMPGTTQSTGMGVYIGIWHADYHKVLWDVATSTSNYVAYHATGTNSSVSAGRLSYTFGLKGPSMSLDTACSASLVAAHLANSAVQSGEIPGALVGGVSLLLEPTLIDILVSAQMLSSCGRCQTLDSAADGYGRGEACITMLVGKMDSDSGSDCMAVLYGAAVNQDGRSSSLTAPNGPAQQAVVQAAWSNSSVPINQMRSLQVSLVA